jgi:hypothetical protein
MKRNWILKNNKGANMIELGQKVKCKVTGFEGTVVTRAEYLHGCARLGVQPPVGKDGKVPDEMTVDEPQLEVVGKKKVIEVKMPKEIVPLGTKAKDPVTGYEGIVTARAVHLNGCARVALQPKHDPKSEKKFDQGIWFPEPQVKLVSETPKVAVGSRRTGGPAPLKTSHPLDARR